MTDQLTDYYKLLGVAETASEAKIKAAYRKKVRAGHSDTLGIVEHDHPAKRQTQLILEAGATLLDEETRKRYDALLKELRNPHSGQNNGINLDDLSERDYIVRRGSSPSAAPEEGLLAIATVRIDTVVKKEAAQALSEIRRKIGALGKELRELRDGLRIDTNGLPEREKKTAHEKRNATWSAANSHKRTFSDAMQYAGLSTWGREIGNTNIAWNDAIDSHYTKMRTEAARIVRLQEEGVSHTISGWLDDIGSDAPLYPFIREAKLFYQQLYQPEDEKNFLEAMRPRIAKLLEELFEGYRLTVQSDTPVQEAAKTGEHTLSATIRQEWKACSDECTNGFEDIAREHSEDMAAVMRRHEHEARKAAREGRQNTSKAM